MKSGFPRQVVQTLCVSGLGLLLAIVTSVVVTRSLGPEGKGVYAVAVHAIGILIGVGQFGLPEVMLSQMRADRRRSSELAANNLIFIVAGTALLAALFWATYPLLGNSFYKGVGSSVMWLAFLMLPFNLAFLFFNRLIHLDGQLTTYNLLMLASRGATLIAVLICLRVQPGEPESVILGLVISLGLMGVLAISLVRSRVVSEDWRINLTLLGESLRGGLKVQVGMLAHLLNQYMGIFILNYFLDLRSVGWFSTALGLASYMLLLPNALRTVLQAWMPNTASLPDQIAERTVMATRHTAFMLCAASLAATLVGLPLIRFLYGSEFEPSYLPMLILLPGLVAAGVGQILASHLDFEGYLGLSSFAAVVAVMVNLSLVWVLVPSLGMWGAGLATTTGHLTHTLILAYYFLRKTDRQLVEFLPKASDAQLYVNLLRPATWFPG